MIIGRMDQRVELQQPSYSCNAVGEPTETFATIATVWAQVEPLSGKEFEASYAEKAQVDLKVIMRYYPGIGPTWRLKHGDKYYNIVAVLNLLSGKNDLKIMCKEIPATVV